MKVLLAVVIGVVVFVAVGLVAVKPIIWPCPWLASTSVPITSPAAGSHAPESPLVQGTACNIPSGKGLFVLVVAPGVPGYYPQNENPIGVTSGGEWSQIVGLGGPPDVGKPFTLYTAVADQEGEAAIQDYFKAAPNFLPLNPLPTSIQLISKIDVVRE